MGDIINDLLNPEAYPDKTDGISLIQTHISFIFLTDHLVYKVKKPVNFGFVDYSTIQKREYFCHQEVDLNQRCSKDIYLDVIPVLFDGDYHRIGKGRGEVVEYAVRMKRLPEEMLMKSCFEKKEIKKSSVIEIAAVISDFHQNARYSSEIDRFGTPDIVKISTDENFEAMKTYIGNTIEKADYQTIKEWTDNFYKEKRHLFFDRIESKKIRDCHGDLHMANIYLTDPIAIIDCVEFNDRFRYTDTLADIAFLIMDLEYSNGKDIADMLWNHYRESAREKGVASLLTFYKVYRAYVRGKINSLLTEDKNIGPGKQEEAFMNAKRYFLLARKYIP
ncbi:hypothetical protein JXL19_10355 [bacterium]|nr:hypothetical protein [bacterium]